MYSCYCSCGTQGYRNITESLKLAQYVMMPDVWLACIYEHLQPAYSIVAAHCCTALIGFIPLLIRFREQASAVDVDVQHGPACPIRTEKALDLEICGKCCMVQGSCYLNKGAFCYAHE